MASAGHLDITLNVISHGGVHGTPPAEMAWGDFERPILSAVRTTFLTTRAGPGT